MDKLGVIVSAVVLLFTITNVSAGRLEGEKHDANFGNECSLRLKLPSGGRINGADGHGGFSIYPPKGFEASDQEITINLTCGKNANSDFMSHSPAIFDPENLVWVKDLETDVKKVAPGLNDRENAIIKNAVHFYPLTAMNSKGFLYTEDDINGDEALRGRRLNFCLVYGVVTLCGYSTSEIMTLSQGRKGDLTPYFKDIIESITFLGSEQ